ncbi:uncharacterized protein LOC118580016 [Onychomys torridus]|uniref:uncharacterized protein LOC118580016 n=1 Tax=Onychomys torridus TaxID=38674 RepID=UPI00167FA1BA|nr:uncharacterized protein LOC118580016 [Onychomys torridus]
MGQTVTTPLSLTLDHWSDVKARANNEGLVVKKKKWITLCEADWVMMNVEGKVFAPGPHGHLDQVPYIAIWKLLATRTHRRIRGIGRRRDWRPWPPCRCQRDRRPPRQRQRDRRSPQRHQCRRRSPNILHRDSGRRRPRLPPQLLVAYKESAKRDEPAKVSRAFPLREGPNHQLQYWPFSASDLYNWKQHNPPFSKDPVALTNLIESILVTHQPMWDDCQQLLQTLLTVEEKQRVFLEARKQVPGDDRRPTQLPNVIDAAFPLTRLNWDFMTPEGREHLRLFHQLLLAGLRGAARRPTNLAQVRNVVQGKDEMLAAFLERLKEAYRMYTPYDPEDPGQAPSVILSFIYQSSPDIRAKLQRLEGLNSFNLSDLLKEAEKAFNSSLSDRTSLVQGATGSRRYRWTTKRKVQLASGQVTHSFLHIPDCPHPLLGQDLLTKLKAQIYFDDKGSTVIAPKGTPLQVLALRLEEEYRLFESESSKEPPEGIQGWLREFPSAWPETGGLGLARDQPPLVIQLKTSTTPVSIKQYPMSREAHEGIKPHIRRLLDRGVLVPCRSPWNTPLLPVKKPGTGDYRLVQDLTEVNKRVEDIHPMVPNPYNLLSTLPPTHIWYTVLDLKDAFFCLRLHPQSQLLFTFEWRDPEMGLSGQLTWTRLPQGFKNSPTLFDEALHSDLAEFRVEHPALILL